MRETNTATTNMKYLGWKIVPFNMPFLDVEPPPLFSNFSQPFPRYLDNGTHKALLAESLNLYNEIWTTLAQV